ncbi:hypothetical protein BDZ85DRAFT_254933 [Elsinoe ampelina]|uniref:Uncharacterized protein n=1 Tax=Elsinoe ampelina TaxID=302913 RepID=A0A6A6GQG5_9PEZI|nr:hypothetical protein BDZ85DRAFT_254933 [Elsinoe ampelina]
MAFRQPQQRPQAQRRPSYQQDPAAGPPQAQQRKRTLEESQQDWILFSPPSQTNTSQTPRTADLSRASYFGSLETGVRSDLLESDDHIVRQVTISNPNDDDGTELDSLDDGLHAFQLPPSPHLDQSGGTVLPTHDGLGAFPATFNGNHDALQEQLWQHERYNPQRRHIHRRLSSVQRRLDALEENGESTEIDPQEERRLRVERWRTEQSKAVLEEIERETRRRYRRMNKGSASAPDVREAVVGRSTASVMTGHASDATEVGDTETKVESESFWQRITRKVIRDLMGLDQNTLSVIFGEDLPEELSNTPTQDSPIAEVAASDAGRDAQDRTWEERLLERVARELGILVYQLSELESAFSTYTSRHPQQLPPLRRASSGIRPHPEPLPADLETALPSIFRPTLNRTSPISGDASLWGIEEEPQTTATNDPAYWESNPSVFMIFSYLRRRLLASPPASPNASTGPLPASWSSAPNGTASALGTSPESQRRADLIRRNHPLVSRANDRRRESALIRRHRNELLGVLHRRQGSSSCASQSTKRSRRSSGTGQSRKYWDFPGASEGGSVVTSAGGAGGAAGGWGEV